MKKKEDNKVRVKFERDSSLTLAHYESLNFPVNTIFEINFLTKGLGYAKIYAEFTQVNFDIYECTSSGEVIEDGLRTGIIIKQEIAERLYEGDWRIYSKLE